MSTILQKRVIGIYNLVNRWPGNRLYLAQKAGSYPFAEFVMLGKLSEASLLNSNRDLLEELKMHILIPEPLELVDYDQELFCVTNWIEGEPLQQYVHRQFAHTRWSELDANRKAKLTGRLYQFLLRLKEIVALQYSFDSFILDDFLVKERTVYLLNLDVIKSFEQGTAAADLGIALIRWFTDLSVNQLDTNDLAHLRQSLLYLTADYQITDLIVDCFDNNNSLSLSILLENALYVVGRLNGAVKLDNKPSAVSFFAGVRKETFSGMVLGNMLPVLLADDSIFGTINELDSTLKEGISGILHLSRRVGYDAHLHLSLISEQRTTLMSPGLYNGMAGIAMGMEDALLIEQALFRRPVSIDIATGAAGQGLVVLHKLHLLGVEKAKEISQFLIASVLAVQQSDGSWLHERDHIGFMNGTSGIATYLFLYYHYFGDSDVILVAERAMQWLTASAVKEEEGLKWDMKYGSQTPWLANGLAGVALSYITAFHVTGNEQYKLFAEEILNSVPHSFFSNHLGCLHGMAGLGETYLEAWRVFKNPVWRSRAFNIANDLLHVSKVHPSGGLYWITEENDLPSRGLLKGNAGILHFLLRFTREAEDIPHVLLPF